MFQRKTSLFYRMPSALRLPWINFMLAAMSATTTLMYVVADMVGSSAYNHLGYVVALISTALSVFCCSVTYQSASKKTFDDPDTLRKFRKVTLESCLTVSVVTAVLAALSLIFGG